MTRFRIAILALASTIFSAVALAAPVEEKTGAVVDRFVSGSGVHHFTTAVVHSTEPTATGLIQRSTDTVDLTGDLAGRIVYHPVSVFDFTSGTLVNTGHQVFSGTILGSDPVLLLDDDFRFEVDLATGATVGEVHLERRLAGPDVRCDLEVIGTGLTPDGNATFDYSGECRFRPSRAKNAQCGE